MCSEYYEFGKHYFGTFLFGFTKWLDKNIKNKKVDKIFFFSRDGYMMKKAFEEISELSSKSVYVYFSRKSIRQALLCKCESYNESIKYLSVEKYVSLGKILEYYGFSDSEREELAGEYGLCLHKEYKFADLGTSEELEKIYMMLKNQIYLMSSKQRDYLLKYLKQIDMKGDCAIVDIGWHGSMQYYLETFCRENNWPIHLFGYYVGVLPSVPILGETHGFVYNEKNTKFRKSMLCFFGVLEKLFQSLEGSTYGYEYKDEKIVPILNIYEYENNDKFIRCISEWQKGALDYISEEKSACSEENSYIHYAMPLIKCGKNPSLKNVKLFSFFYNTDGIKEYYVSQKGLFQYKPKELLHELSNSVWKTGFMKSVFKIPFPYYWVYCLLKK